MTPKEKAVELTDTNKWWMCTKEQCKKYALIVVNEVINTGTLIDEDTYVETSSYLQYWNNVKSEIEKL